MTSPDEQANRCSPCVIGVISIYILFNILLVIAPFVILPEAEGKVFWTMVITNIHILLLLLVTMSQDPYIIASWLFVDVCYILYFCYFSIMLVAQYISEMGNYTTGSCSLFTIPPADTNCSGLRIQFKSVVTVFIIVFVIIPVEVWLFISVNGFRKRQMFNSKTTNVARGTQTITGMDSYNTPTSFTAFRLGGAQKEILSIPTQDSSRSNLINGDSSLIDIDSSSTSPQKGQIFPVYNKTPSFLDYKENDIIKMDENSLTKSANTKKSVPSSRLSKYSPKIVPALRIQ